MQIDYDFQRPVTRRYRDPLDVVWLTTARRLGLTVRRNPHVHAASDGHGLLEISTPGGFDADDCLAQMIFHEVCHWIANGAETLHERDWGFPLEDLDDWRELSGLRVQAALAERYGLRELFASTAGLFRQYYDLLPTDPMAPIDDTELEARVVALAEEGLANAEGAPWAPHLQRALEATRSILLVVEPFLADFESDIEDDLPSLWEARAAHRRAAVS